MYESEGKSVQECIDCGFRNEMGSEPETEELETRVNSKKKTLQHKLTEAQPLRFYPNPKSSSKKD